LKGLLKHRFH